MRILNTLITVSRLHKSKSGYKSSSLTPPKFQNRLSIMALRKSNLILRILKILFLNINNLKNLKPLKYVSMKEKDI